MCDDLLAVIDVATHECYLCDFYNNLVFLCVRVCDVDKRAFIKV